MMLLAAVLATWKLTILLIQYDGPLDIFRTIKRFLSKLQGKLKFVDLECFFCTSLYVSLPLAVLLADGWMVVLYWFAISGGASIIDEALTTL